MGTDRERPARVPDHMLEDPRKVEHRGWPAPRLPAPNKPEAKGPPLRDRAVGALCGWIGPGDTCTYDADHAGNHSWEGPNAAVGAPPDDDESLVEPPSPAIWEGLPATRGAVGAPPPPTHRNAAGVEFVTVACSVCKFTHAHPVRASEQANPPLDVDELAQIIRTVDGNHSLGAGALAEAIIAALGSTPSRSGEPSSMDRRATLDMLTATW